MTDMDDSGIEIDLSEVTTRQELHEILAEAFHFPDDYGKDWDAFRDCISDPLQSQVPSQVEIVGFSVLRQVLPREAALLKAVLEEESGSFSVVYRDDGNQADDAGLVEISCPYCGEPIEIVVDTSVEQQSYIEDCQVCCRPINLAVTVDEEGMPSVDASAEDEA
jgi:RNAse (barnase) inhibitor barstar